MAVSSWMRMQMMCWEVSEPSAADMGNGGEAGTRRVAFWAGVLCQPHHRRGCEAAGVDGPRAHGRWPTSQRMNLSDNRAALEGAVPVNRPWMVARLARGPNLGARDQRRDRFKPIPPFLQLTRRPQIPVGCLFTSCRKASRSSVPLGRRKSRSESVAHEDAMDVSGSLGKASYAPEVSTYL